MVPDRSGQVWRDGVVIFVVLRPPLRFTGIACFHPVVILAIESINVGGAWEPGTTENWPEDDYPWTTWELRLERIA